MKTTKKDFEIFKKEFLKWFNVFGLKDWKIYFFHDQIDETSYANITYNVAGRVATVRFNLEHNGRYNNIKETAFHEVCELLLGKLVAVAEYRYVTENEITEATHDIIRRLEKVIFGNEK